VVPLDLHYFKGKRVKLDIRWRKAKSNTISARPKDGKREATAGDEKKLPVVMPCFPGSQGILGRMQIVVTPHNPTLRRYELICERTFKASPEVMPRSAATIEALKQLKSPLHDSEIRADSNPYCSVLTLDLRSTTIIIRAWGAASARSHLRYAGANHSATGVATVKRRSHPANDLAGCQNDGGAFYPCIAVQKQSTHTAPQPFHGPLRGNKPSTRGLLAYERYYLKP
jgi:hypothetical protein